MSKDAADKKQQKRPGEGTRKGKKMVDEAIKRFNDERSKPYTTPKEGALDG